MIRVVAPALLCLLAAACASPRRDAAPAAPRSVSALDRMEHLALAANRCWFKSNDPAFAAYSLAPELSSFSGRPRFLLVPRGRPEAKPLLVVEGRSGAADVLTYGPVMDGPLGSRVAADIRRWNAGSGQCAA